MFTFPFSFKKELLTGFDSFIPWIARPPLGTDEDKKGWGGNSWEEEHTRTYAYVSLKHQAFIAKTKRGIFTPYLDTEFSTLYGTYLYNPYCTYYLYDTGISYE